MGVGIVGMAVGGSEVERLSVNFAFLPPTWACGLVGSDEGMKEA